MIAFRMAFRSVMRRRWALLLVIPPVALLFAMVTFLLASESAVHRLLDPGLAPRAFRIGAVEGIASFEELMFTAADVSQVSHVSGASLAPAFFHDCGVAGDDLAELTCSVTNRTYVEVWGMDIFVPPDELDHWDQVKSGAIVTRAAAQKHGWKVGDHIHLLYDTQTSKKGEVMELIITYIADKYIDPTIVYIHIEFQQQRFAGIDTLRYWDVWVLVDQPARREAIMQEMDRQLAHPHIIWTMEVTRQALLQTSVAMRESFRFAGVFSLALVVCLALTLLILSIEARNAEFAALLAIGYRRGLLARTVLVEGLLLLPPAALLGALAIWVPLHAHPVHLDANFSVTVSLTNAFEATLVGAVVGLLSATVPAWRVFRLDTVTALR